MYSAMLWEESAYSFFTKCGETGSGKEIGNGTKENMYKRTISQFDEKRYKDELARLREEMTDILLEMEARHGTSSGEAFTRWWDEEGAMRRYFDLKGKAEKIEQILACSVMEPEEHPKMRGKEAGTRRGYGVSEDGQ